MINQTLAVRILRWPDVQHLTGLSKSAKDRLQVANQFPIPVKLSPDPKTRAVGWLSTEVEEWINERASVRVGV